MTSWDLPLPTRGVPLPIDRRRDMERGDLLSDAILDMMEQICVPVVEIPGVLVDAYLEHDPVTVWHVRGVMRDPHIEHIPGAVGRFLDRLPRHCRVIVWAVTSRTLAEMLDRRGFEIASVYDPKIGMVDDGVMMRHAGTEPDVCGVCGTRHERGDEHVDA